jgi:hypothetical protein
MEIFEVANKDKGRRHLRQMQSCRAKATHPITEDVTTLLNGTSPCHESTRELRNVVMVCTQTQSPWEAQATARNGMYRSNIFFEDPCESSNYLQIEEWHVILGDTQCGGRKRRTTVATQMLRQVKDEYKRSNPGKRKDEWIPSAIATFRNRVNKEFGITKYPTVPKDDVGLVFVKGTKKAVASKRVASPFTHGYQGDKEPTYGIAKDLEALVFFLKSRDATTLKKDLMAHRKNLEDLRYRPEQQPLFYMMDEFDESLKFFEKKLEKADEGDGMAKRLLEALCPIKPLREQWNMLKSCKQPQGTVLTDNDKEEECSCHPREGLGEVSPLGAPAKKREDYEAPTPVWTGQRILRCLSVDNTNEPSDETLTSISKARMSSLPSEDTFQDLLRSGAACRSPSPPLPADWRGTSRCQSATTEDLSVLHGSDCLPYTDDCINSRPCCIESLLGDVEWIRDIVGDCISVPDVAAEEGTQQEHNIDFDDDVWLGEGCVNKHQLGSRNKEEHHMRQGRKRARTMNIDSLLVKGTSTEILHGADSSFDMWSACPVVVQQASLEDKHGLSQIPNCDYSSLQPAVPDKVLWLHLQYCRWDMAQCPLNVNYAPEDYGDARGGTCAFTCLHVACQNRSPFDIVDRLLTLNPGAVNRQDMEGWTPLHHHLWNGNDATSRRISFNPTFVPIFELLLNESAARTYAPTVGSPLHIFCSRGHADQTTELYIFRRLIFSDRTQICRMGPSGCFPGGLLWQLYLRRRRNYTGGPSAVHNPSHQILQILFLFLAAVREDYDEDSHTLHEVIAFQSSYAGPESANFVSLYLGAYPESAWIRDSKGRLTLEVAAAA